MKHRHINTDEWTFDAIASALERGSLTEWRELFAVVRWNQQTARDVLHVAAQQQLGGAGVLAGEIVRKWWPNLTL